jgi:hypothetical protein
VGEVCRQQGGEEARVGERVGRWCVAEVMSGWVQGGL